MYDALVVVEFEDALTVPSPDGLTFIVKVSGISLKFATSSIELLKPLKLFDEEFPV